VRERVTETSLVHSPQACSEHRHGVCPSEEKAHEEEVFLSALLPGDQGEIVGNYRARKKKRLCQTHSR